MTLLERPLFVFVALGAVTVGPRIFREPQLCPALCAGGKLDLPAAMRECEQEFVFLEVVHEPDRLATETLQDFFDLLAARISLVALAYGVLIMFCFLSRLFDADRSSVRCDDASLDRFPTHAPCSANAMRAVENPIPTALAGLFDHQNRRGFFPFPQHGDKGVHGVRPVTRQRFDLAERDRASVQRLRFFGVRTKGIGL